MRYRAALALIPLIFVINGCCEPEVRYIETPCANMQTWEVAPLDENITYEVYDENGKS